MLKCWVFWELMLKQCEMFELFTFQPSYQMCCLILPTEKKIYVCLLWVGDKPAQGELRPLSPHYERAHQRYWAQIVLCSQGIMFQWLENETVCIFFPLWFAVLLYFDVMHKITSSVVYCGNNFAESIYGGSIKSVDSVLGKKKSFEKVFTKVCHII